MRQEQTSPCQAYPVSSFTERGALNIAESAAYCGVRCAAIEAAIRDGRLTGRRLGRNVIVLKADLDDFLENLDVIPAHTPPSILRRREARSEKMDVTRCGPDGYKVDS